MEVSLLFLHLPELQGRRCSLTATGPALGPAAWPHQALLDLQQSCSGLGPGLGGRWPDRELCEAAENFFHLSALFSVPRPGFFPQQTFLLIY